MTSIARSQVFEDQFSSTRCHICNFPAGKLTNKDTGEVVRVWFYKASGGRYVCNLCVESGRGVPVVKMDKKSRNALKKAWKGR